jgi:hypothetical protein
MKNYIIVGDNNYWYSTTGLVTKEQLQNEIEMVKQYIKDNQEEVSELYVYEASESSLTINL